MLLIRRVVGQSMSPNLRHGQLVVGLRWQLKPARGRVIILEHDGREKIKRVASNETTRLYVLGDNPDASTDSRTFGWVPASALRAVVIWPRLRS